MNRKCFIFSIATSLAFANGVFANSPNRDIEVFDVNSIEYIEEEVVIELGFDVADYLPEGFDPYKIYVDLNAVIYIEDEEIQLSNLSKYLPVNFDAYSFPKDVQSMNFIDENDKMDFDFDSKKYLPKGFNAYIK